MCGIFGCYPLTESVARMLPLIGAEMENRGRDAWGASDGNDVFRRVGPLHETWSEIYPNLEKWDGKAAIFHTRGASHGSPKKLENAHPFTFYKEDGTSVIGIHNGIINNHEELNKRYGRNFEVDSMHLWQSRAEGRAWDDMEGWGNLAWFETLNGKMDIHLSRFNNNNLELFKLKGGEFLFASTQAPVRIAARMFGNPVDMYCNLDEYRHYWIGPDAQTGEIKLFKGGELPFPKPWNNGTRGTNMCNMGYVTYPLTQRHTIPLRNTRANATVDMDWCMKCGVMRIDKKEQFICGSCLLGFMIDWEQMQQRKVIAL